MLRSDLTLPQRMRRRQQVRLELSPTEEPHLEDKRDGKQAPPTAGKRLRARVEETTRRVGEVAEEDGEVED
jgi:hypothetical protein